MRQQGNLPEAELLSEEWAADFAADGGPLKVYAASIIVLADKNIVPSAVTYAGLVTGYIDFDQAARDMAAAIGVYAEQPATAYLEQKAVGLVKDRSLLLDDLGQVWLVHGAPIHHRIGVGSFSLQALVTRTYQKVDGLP